MAGLAHVALHLADGRQVAFARAAGVAVINQLLFDGGLDVAD